MTRADGMGRRSTKRIAVIPDPDPGSIAGTWNTPPLLMDPGSGAGMTAEHMHTSRHDWNRCANSTGHRRNQQAYAVPLPGRRRSRSRSLTPPPPRKRLIIGSTALTARCDLRNKLSQFLSLCPPTSRPMQSQELTPYDTRTVSDAIVRRGKFLYLKRRSRRDCAILCEASLADPRLPNGSTSSGNSLAVRARPPAH